MFVEGKLYSVNWVQVLELAVDNNVMLKCSYIYLFRKQWCFSLFHFAEFISFILFQDAQTDNAPMLIFTLIM